MSRLRNSPRTHRGAIIAIDSTLPIPTVIGFQYNPESMSRTLSPHASGADGSKSEVQRVDRPPTEKIKLKAEFDATDGLEVKDPIAVTMGVYPQLSALETLLYPPKTRVIANNVLTALGVVEIVPPMAPLTLFVWGPKRVLPVRIENLTIEETAYDERLNPIQANVDLDLRVLNYADFCTTDPGAFIFLAHQAIKEAMAATGTARSTVSFF
jgi:hypothetical protein